MVRFEYFEDGKLLLTKYIGNINKEAIKSYIQYIFLKSDSAKLEKLILDYREANVLFNPKALMEIADIRKSSELGRIKNRSVFLVDKPRETALISLISILYNKNMNPVDFCYTSKRCVESLSLDMTEDELEKNLKGLKYEFIGDQC